MSGYSYQSDPDGDELAGNSGGGLRKQLEEVLSENKRLAEALEQQNSKAREESVTALLQDNGLDPAVQKFIPGDTDPAEWVKENAHLFGKQAGEQQGGTAGQAATPDPASSEEAEARAAMQSAQESGLPVTYTNETVDQVQKINSVEEWNELSKKFGGPTVTSGF